MNRELLKSLVENYKVYEDILKRCLPFYYPKYTDKRKREENKTLTIFNSIVYSTVGSAIYEGKQQKFIENIIYTLKDKYTELNSKNYITCLYCAVALFQLSEEEAAIIGNNEKRKLGYWLDYFLDKTEHQRKQKLTLEKYKTFSRDLVKNLVSGCLKSGAQDIIYQMNAHYKSPFTEPEIGLLILTELVGLENMKKWLLDGNFYKNYKCSFLSTGILPLSKMFLPLEKAEINNVNKKKDNVTSDYYDVNKICYNIPNCLKDRQMKFNKNSACLIELHDSELIKIWAVSCMINTCYLILGEKSKLLQIYKPYILDVQMVVTIGGDDDDDDDNDIMDVCLFFPSTSINCIKGLTDLQDVGYLEQNKEPGYQYIAATLAIYLRMLLFLNPYPQISNPFTSTYYLFISRHYNSENYSKLFFYANKPSFIYREEITQIDNKHRQIKIDEINNFISKFILEKKWDTHIEKNPSTLFRLEHYLNIPQIITGGAQFIKNIYANDFEYTEQEDPNYFLKYTRRENHAKLEYDRLYRNMYIYNYLVKDKCTCSVCIDNRQLIK